MLVNPAHGFHIAGKVRLVHALCGFGFTAVTELGMLLCWEEERRKKKMERRKKKMKERKKKTKERKK